jgi:shikimate kinase
MSPKAVLIGLPGTGKSTTGRRLAKILCVPFADSDELIEDATGRPIVDIFATDGEAAFRALEADAIAAALTDFDGVLALGGGAVLTDRTRDALSLSGVEVVQLQAQLDTLLTRVGDARTRPLLQDDPPARLAALAAERAPLFAALATMTVETDQRTAGQVAATIAARLHERAARP